MKPKYIVYCGQDLEEGDVPVDITTDDMTWYIFPEASGGSNYVSNLVSDVVAIGHTAVFLTRYPHIIEAFGGLICDEKVDPFTLKIILVRKDHTGCMITEHEMNKDGIMENNWPFGILG